MKNKLISAINITLRVVVLTVILSSLPAWVAWYLDNLYIWIMLGMFVALCASSLLYFAVILDKLDDE